MENQTEKPKNAQDEKETFHNKDKNEKSDLESGDNVAERKRKEDLKDAEGEKSTKDEGF